MVLVKQLLIFLQEFLQLFCSHCLIESVVSSFVYLPAPHFYVIELEPPYIVKELVYK
jgi:hypothetical protein